MLAARWHGRRDVRVEQVPDPKPGPDEVLIAVEHCGLCGTDLEEYQHGPVSIPVGEPLPFIGRTAPIVLGHEIVGIVAAQGTEGKCPALGTRMIPDVVLGCGRCWWCRRHQQGLCPDVVRLLAPARIPLPRVIADGFAAPPSGCKVLVDPRPSRPRPQARRLQR